MSSPTKQNNHRLSGGHGGISSPEKTISPINNLKEFLDNNGKLENHSNNSSSSDDLLLLPKQINNRIIMNEESVVNSKGSSPSKVSNISTTATTTNAPFGGKLESVSLQSFNAMLDKLSPRNETKVRVFHCVQCFTFLLFCTKFVIKILY